MRWFRRIMFQKRKFYDEQPSAETVLFGGTYKTISDTFLTQHILDFAEETGCDIRKVKLGNADYVSCITLFCYKEEYLRFIKAFLEIAGDYVEGVEV